MTGTVNGLCYRRKRMTGRAAAGVVEEKPCSSGTVAPASIPAAVPAGLPEKRGLASFHLDFYTQARKALSERSPFDSDEVVANTVATLPSGLAGLVLKHTDSRKKHKKSHSDSKASKKGSVEKNKSSTVWTEVEECFRQLTVPDIDKLFHLSVSVDNLGRDSYFRVPVPGSLLSSNKLEEEVAEVKEVEKVEVRNDIRDPANVAKEEPNGDCAEVGSGVEAMDVDAEAGQRNGLPSEGGKQSNNTLQPTDRQGTDVQLLRSVEWVLGSRSKILLSTTRPSKKRKLLGENAGLQRLIVAHPCEGKPNICHFCSMGDTGDQLNRLVVCSACKMAAHQRCYGIQGDVSLSWMCSWCTWSRHREATHLLNKGTSGDRPCVLCPRSGGALKPLGRDVGGNGSSVDFAHLFCSEWMPEELAGFPSILHVQERQDIDLRCGESLDVELRAYCFKHSDLPNGGGAIQHGQQDFAIVSASLPSIPSLHLNKPSEDEVIHKNGDRIAVSVRSSNASSDKLEDGGLQETLLQDTADSVEHTFEHKINIDLRDVENMVERTAEGACSPECINLSPDIKKVEVDPVETEGPLAAYPISSSMLF
ncbi:PHD finger protein rhinoceros-like protein [Drosera capensis]